MNRIVIPAETLAGVIARNQGRRTILPCKVDWPELRLTEQQILENAMDHAAGRTGRHPDPSYIELVFER